MEGKIVLYKIDDFLKWVYNLNNWFITVLVIITIGAVTGSSVAIVTLLIVYLLFTLVQFGLIWILIAIVLSGFALLWIWLISKYVRQK